MSFRDRIPQYKWTAAKRMRKFPTPAESTLWPYLSKKQLGIRFRRQVPMYGWIVDFWCPKAKLVIEVDGAYHDYPSQKKLDDIKDSILAKHNITVLRFTNKEVLTDINKVLNNINIYTL